MTRRREGGHLVRTIHAITPETEKSCFYFFNKADGYSKFESADTVRTWASTTDVFKEDAFMLEQQQLRLENFDTDKLMDINTDVARVQMIRALKAQTSHREDECDAGTHLEKFIATIRARVADSTLGRRLLRFARNDRGWESSNVRCCHCEERAARRSNLRHPG